MSGTPGGRGRKKITPELERELVRRATEGYSAAECARWLQREHNVEVTRQAVDKVLQRTRSARADVAKIIVRETLGPHLPGDLTRLEVLREELQSRQRDAWEQGLVREYVALVTAEIKILDRKLHYSGAGQRDKDAKRKELAGLSEPDLCARMAAAVARAQGRAA